MRELTPKERGAMFARMKTRRFAFPVKGRGGRSRRNRRILYGLGTAALGGAALLGVRGGRKWALNLVSAEAGKVTNLGKAGGGYSWVYDRPATESGEKFMSGLPWIGPKLYGTHTVRGVGATGDKYSHTMLHGVPLIGKAQVAAKRWLRNTAAAGLERISLWNALGSKQNTLDAITDTAAITKMKVASGLASVRNRLIRVPRPTAREEALAMLGRPVRPKPRYSPVERFVSRPFNKLSQALKRADVMGRRRAIQFIRRRRKP